MRIRLDPESPLPASHQIITAVKFQVLSGALRSGDRLPPIRELAKYLKVNPNTVAKAYASLESEGFLESRVGSGTWVRRPRGVTDDSRLALLESECRSFLDKVLPLGFSREEIAKTIRRLTHGR